MSSLLLSLPDLFNSYKTWVSKNPQIVSDYETTAKWVSYFIAGRIHNSHIVSELVYCISNLLVLFNDGIIRKSIDLKLASSSEKIKLWLTVIEYSEVFCELSLQKVWGNTGKWFIIVVIQVFKCVARLLLIYKHKENIIENPPIPPLERKKISKDGNSNDRNLTGFSSNDLNSVSFTLKRSGRTIRKVESSPPLNLRNWKPIEMEPKISVSNSENNQLDEGYLQKKQLVAESIYVSKPIVHLISMSLFGTRTWKPWMISLAMDLTSLQLYKSTQSQPFALSKKQKLQLSKRTVLLLLYLIRSPFYEKHSADKINAFLAAMSNNVPFVKIICQPLLQYSLHTNFTFIQTQCLQLYKSTQSQPFALSKKQKLQLSKRTVLLLLYLIRSPFYEKHSEDKINAFLAAMSNNVPFVKIICQPLLQYLPFWQSNYFYMWST